MHNSFQSFEFGLNGVERKIKSDQKEGKKADEVFRGNKMVDVK